VSDVEAQEAENAVAEPNEFIKDMIANALDQDYNGANKIFGDVMTVRQNDLLDQEKIKLADQIFNGVEPDEDEDDELGDEDDDQLELDLEAEDGDEEEEDEEESESDESEVDDDDEEEEE
jgi:hypothetical protein|tara:strand:+ start:3358 stop:3717 length:360 start_codon:yes stop_codon:yes gene_type:complete